MKEHIKRVARILKYKGSMLEIYTDVIETPEGHRANWDYIEHRGAAAVVPVLDDGRLLMVRQYRDALDRETIEIPAGGLNGWDEPTINAAARELEEETGYRSDNLTKLISVVTAVAFCNEVIDVYLATNLKKTSCINYCGNYTWYMLCKNVVLWGCVFDRISDCIYQFKCSICRCVAGSDCLQAEEICDACSIYDYTIQKTVCVLAVSV